MSTIRFAFTGFRHGHIYSLLEKVKACPDTTLVAACEEDAETRAALSDGDKVTITHDDTTTMLAEVPCDVLAIGDYYGKRGALALQGLQAGKHVILDKPVCTGLDEWNDLRALTAETGLALGCQLDMRADPRKQTLRKLILDGEIGDVLTFSFSGQHPLMLGSRPMWYFEQGKHGGTINDIAIHAMDAIPWMTGLSFTEVLAARAWNAKAKDYPWFKDCAQFMLTMENGAGVFGDVSYLSPDTCGYSVRQYWRMTVHGTHGLLEIRQGDSHVMLATDSDKAPREIPAEACRKEGYFEDFLREIRSESGADDLTTADVLRASRVALTVQHAADVQQCHVAL